MKKVLLSVLVAMVAVGAHAMEAANKDGKAVGSQMQNGNYFLGEVYLREADKSGDATDVDVFALRNCRTNQNALITKIRLRAPIRKPNGVKNLDALIRKVTIIYGNGEGDTFTMAGQGEHLKVTNNSGDGLTIDLPGNRRCVRAISVSGEQYEAGSNTANTYVRVVGVTGLPR